MFSARIYDALLRPVERRVLGRWRAELLEPVGGDVLDVGAGTGANLPAYGPGVRRLLLLEPDLHMRRRLVQRAASAMRPGTVSPQVIAGSATALPLADGTLDAVICTLVLCSIPAPDRALREFQRVLRPDGHVVVLEHVAAPPGTTLRAAQHLLTPIWSRLADGCCLERPTRELLSAAGFDVSDLREDTLPLPLPVLRPALRGTARPGRTPPR